MLPCTLSPDQPVLLTTNIVLQPPSYHEGRVYCVSGSTSGRELATCGEDCDARLWDAERGTFKASRERRALLCCAVLTWPGVLLWHTAACYSTSTCFAAVFLPSAYWTAHATAPCSSSNTTNPASFARTLLVVLLAYSLPARRACSSSTTHHPLASSAFRI